MIISELTEQQRIITNDGDEPAHSSVFSFRAVYARGT
jgi:hypothetical protein